MKLLIKFNIFFWLACLICLLHNPALAEDQDEFNLQQALHLALEYNDQIMISRENLQQAKGDIDIATAPLLPQIEARGEHVRQKEMGGMAPTPDRYNLFTLRASQHIYQMGKLWSGRRLAEHYYQGTTSEHVRNSQEILYQVGAIYYDVLLAQRSIEIAQDFLKRAQTQLNRAQALYDAGKTTETDVLRARVLVAQAREELEQAKNQYDIALEDLALEIGQDELPAEPIKPESPQSPAEELNQLYQLGLEHRLDLDKAKQALQAEKQRVEVERADFFPRLSLEGQYSRTDEDQLFQDEKEDWQASLQLSYPLFTGGQRRAELAQARSKHTQAEASLRRMQREIRNQVRSAYLDIQTRKRIVEHLQEEVQAARSHYQRVLAQYEEGLATSVDLVDAHTAYNEAEHSLVQAQYGLDLDKLHMQFALGTLYKDLIKEKELEN